MTIECYFSSCPHHSIHYGDEGPFCDELECIAPKDKLEQYGRERLAQLQAIQGQPGDASATVSEFDSSHAHDMYAPVGGIPAGTIMVFSGQVKPKAQEIVDERPASDTPPAVLYPHSKVAEFFTKPDFKEFVGGRRIGQAFYDFMEFKPEGQSINVNHKLDKIYEADGAEAKALIESYADFSS